MAVLWAGWNILTQWWPHFCKSDCETDFWSSDHCATNNNTSHNVRGLIVVEQKNKRSTYCLELTGDFVMEREGRQQCILWKSSVYIVYTLCILSWWVLQTKYLGPSSSNIQYLTSPDQKLSKNIYFMVRMVNFVICAWPELFNFPAPTAKFRSKLPDQNWSAPRQN